jgi:PAT family beta-lactamase induction signal transducer AmpG
METESPRGFKAIFADRNLLLMLALGFSSGLPIRLVYVTPSIWFHEAGVPLATISLIYEMTLPYSLKFLWAPFIDQYDAPFFGARFGRRRGWMLVAQIACALALIGVGFGDPAHNLAWSALFALALGFAGATQDIVIDGWRIAITPPERQGVMASAAQYGYQIALFVAGAGALYLAQYGSWKIAYLAMAALMAVGAIACLYAPEPQSKGALHVKVSMRDAIADPLREIFRRLGPNVALFLLLIAIYRLPDYVSGAMANLLYSTVGFTKAEIATVTKLYGFWVGLAGVFVGGLSVVRLGLMPSMLIGGVAASVSHLSFAWLAVSGPRLDIFTAAISIENFATFFASTVLIAFMSTIVSPAYAATQYAIVTSIYALVGKFAGGASGKLVEIFGFPTFFIGTACIGLPVAALCLIVWRVQFLSDKKTAGPETPSPEQDSLA